MHLSEKFDFLLSSTGLNRTHFAKKTGIQPAVLSQIFPQVGKPLRRDPRLSTLIKIIDGLDGRLTLDDFAESGRALRSRRTKPSPQSRNGDGS
jgi:hypothetical protein